MSRMRTARVLKRICVACVRQVCYIWDHQKAPLALSRGVGPQGALAQRLEGAALGASLVTQVTGLACRLETGGAGAVWPSVCQQGGEWMLRAVVEAMMRHSVRDRKRRMAEPSSTESLQTSHQKHLALHETQGLGASPG